MNIFTGEIEFSLVQNVHVTENVLSVDLSDGRTISVPLGWFPRLEYGHPEERANWRLIGKGHGIHWPELDEDISVEVIFATKPSGENQASLKRWLQSRESCSVKPIFHYGSYYLPIIG